MTESKENSGGDNQIFRALFTEDLVFTEFTGSTKEELFLHLSTILEKNNYVKESFYQGLLEREKNYPTGLRTNSYHIAIPHTDPEHIITPFITVVKPMQPITFYEMGSDDIEVQAEIIFILGIYKAEEQVPLLQNLMEMFIDEETMKALLTINDHREMLEIIKNKII